MCVSFFRVVPILIFTALLTAEGVAATTLRFGGTGGATGMLQRAASEFARSNPVKIEIIPGLGSSGALNALINGKLDLAVSARPLTPREIAAGLKQMLVLRTPFVLATSHAQPQNLKSTDLPKIFEAEQYVWSDGSPIRIILRPRSETDSMLLGELFPGMAQAIEAARRRGNIPTAATDRDNVALAQQIQGSLTGTTLAQLTTERNGIHVISLDGVTPTLANFESGTYRYSKKFYLVLGGNSLPEAEQFIAFLRSPQGTKALRECAVLPDRP